MVSQSETSHSYILAMPLEILAQISTYLTTPEYGNLRLTCQHLDASFFHLFANEFFTKRQFMLTEFSLQALVDISKSRFSSYLTYLIIGIDRPTLDIWHDRFDNSSFMRPGALAPVKKSDSFLQECYSHTALMTTGRASQLLEEAVRNFSNLVTVGMRDYSSRGRYRDGERAEWHSYGAPTLYKETDVHLRSLRAIDDDSDYICAVFTTILLALSKRPEPQPTRLEVILRHHRLPLRAFYIPKYLDSAIQPALENLKAVYLDLDGPAAGCDDSASPQLPPQFPTQFPDRMSSSRMLIARFLSRMSALEHLRLNFKVEMGVEPCKTSDLITWLSGVQTMPIDSLPPPPTFRLRNLDIGFKTTTARELIRLYMNFKSTLCSISLHKITLSQENDHDTNPWAKFFRLLLTSDLKITAITLSWLKQTTEYRTRNIRFQGPTPTYEKQWSGTDLSHALKELKGAFIVEKLPEDDTVTESEYSDSDLDSDVDG